MAAFYQDFTTTIRTTEPEINMLIANLKALDASAGVQHDPGSSAYRLKKGTAWTAPQITAAQNVLETSPAATPQTIAQSEIDALPIAIKALLLVMIDQLNVIRAALPVPLPAITPAQAIAAVRAKAGTL